MKSVTKEMSRCGPGAFIYTGAGRKQAKDADICQHKCKDSACMIQKCLQKYNNSEVICKPFIDAWATCCKNAKLESESLASVTSDKKTT